MINFIGTVRPDSEVLIIGLCGRLSDAQMDDFLNPIRALKPDNLKVLVLESVNSAVVTNMIQAAGYAYVWTDPRTGLSHTFRPEDVVVVGPREGEVIRDAP